MKGRRHVPTIHGNPDSEKLSNSEPVGKQNTSKSDLSLLQPGGDGNWLPCDCKGHLKNDDRSVAVDEARSRQGSMAQCLVDATTVCTSRWLASAAVCASKCEPQ